MKNKKTEGLLTTGNFTKQHSDLPPLTKERMEGMIQEMKELDPIYTWMVSKGYNPDDGWVMVVPVGKGIPESRYVRHARWIDDIFFVQTDSKYDLCYSPYLPTTNKGGG